MSISHEVPPRIACFVTPHGYGHAARACAVMEALGARAPQIRFEVFTRIPERFFSESVGSRCRLHAVRSDIGLVQRGPLRFDLDETVRVLDGFLPFAPGRVHALADKVRETGCRAVLCDIAPLGIEVARGAGVPSILLENFTWDWIYEPFVLDHPGFARHIRALRAVFARADHHIQAEPVCRAGGADLVVPPVCRKPRVSRTETRRALGLSDGTPLVLITMGGIPGEVAAWSRRLQQCRDVVFVVPAPVEEVCRVANRVLLPRASAFYYPDLIHAADAVVGKAGYSTLAEIFHAGNPYGFVASRGFRESEILARFIRDRMRGIAIEEEAFARGEWLDLLPQLLDLPRGPFGCEDGADAAARFVLSVAEGVAPRAPG